MIYIIIQGQLSHYICYVDRWIKTYFQHNYFH